MFRKLNALVSVAGRIAPADVAEAARLGYTTIINNRPDDEQPGQPTGAEIADAAQAAGLAYHAIPIGHDGFPEERIVAMARALDKADGPVLAYCRSGTRSTFLWALARARLGDDGTALAREAAEAGYDVAPIRAWLN